MKTLKFLLLMAATCVAAFAQKTVQKDYNNAVSNGPIKINGTNSLSGTGVFDFSLGTVILPGAVAVPSAVGHTGAYLVSDGAVWTYGAGGGGGGGGGVFSVGLSMPGIFSVSNTPVTSAGTLTTTFLAQPPGVVLAGPVSGPNATPTMRAIADSDLPSALTGKTYNGLSIASTTGNFTIASPKVFQVLNSLTLSGTDGASLNVGTGGTLAASAYTDTTNASNIGAGTLPANRLPFPTTSTLGGVYAKTAVTHQFVTGIGVDGNVTVAQPAAADVTGLAASATTDATNASNISTGTLAANRGGAGTVNGILKGNGAGVVSTAVASTDYAPATTGNAILAANGTGGFSSVTIGTGLSYSAGTLTATGGGGGTGNVTNPAPFTNGQFVYATGNNTVASSNAITTDGLGNITINGNVTISGTTSTSTWSGVVPSANGGAGTVNGIMKANGAGTTSAAVSGTDYAPATTGNAILKGNALGGFASAVSGTDYAPATSGSAVLKGNGTGGFASAASGTDYAPATSGSAILKGNGSGGFLSAVSGTDYAPATSGAGILYGNGAGGFSTVTVGSGLTFSGGTLTSTGGGAATYAPYMTMFVPTSVSTAPTGWSFGGANGVPVFTAPDAGLKAITYLNGTVADTTFSPTPGSTITQGTTITMSSATGNATIYSVTDGSTPSRTNGTAGTTHTMGNASITIKAIAVENYWFDSNVTSASYTYDPPPTVPAGNAVIDTSGGNVTITFSELVSAGDATGFGISPSGGAANMTFVSLNGGGASATYSLDRNIATGETATLAYTDHTGGFVDSAGQHLGSFSGFSVTNNSTYSGTSYDWTEEFESGTTPTGWTTDGGTPTFNVTPAMRGTYMLRCSNASNDSGHITITPTSTTYEAFCYLKLAALPGSTLSTFGVRDSSGTILCLMRVTSTGQVLIRSGSTDSGGTTDTIPANTQLYVWLHYQSGVGASVAWSTSSTRPTGTLGTSGTGFTSITTTGLTNGTVARLSFANAGVATYYDHVLATHTGTIGNNP